MSGVDFVGSAEGVIMLDDIYIPGTKQTPEISCKNKSGEIIFKGNFIASNPNELLEPIQKWLLAYIKEKKSSMISLIFHLTYLNGNSGKSLCSLFKQAEYYHGSGVNFNVEMFYEDDDIDMLEWCKEMKESFHLPFNLSKVN